MTQSKPQAIHLKDYAPSTYVIDNTDLLIALEPERTIVTNTIRVRLQEKMVDKSPDLVLQGVGLELLALQLEGRELQEGSDYSLNENELRIHLPPRQFSLTVVTACNPKANTSLEGLYLSNGRFCTQCEAHGFRKLTYYLDRPDVLARFSTRIVADKQDYPVLLSNGNKVETGELPNGKHFVAWEDPYPKPAYLFALVAGDLACLKDKFTTKSGREVALEIYSEESNIDQCDHAMQALKKSMQWDEEIYGLEYDLDTYMIVAVNDFNMGAMENKGLNIFNAKYVLAVQETATDRDFIDVETVIGHEYFHNWTGNRVTLRDWFQLSLKEGLTVFRDQEFTADMTSRAVRRIEDVAIIQTSQFAEDEGPMAHPVRPASYIEMNNFYTVTVYNKGAEVIRMLHTLLGKQGFHQGMDLYIARHDGKAVTCDDFVQAMEDANGVELKQFRRWYSQAGTPALSLTTAYDAKAQRYIITASQQGKATADHSAKLPWHIPIRIMLYDQEGQALRLQPQGDCLQESEQQVVVSLTEESQQFIFEQVPSKPVPSILQGFSAPVRVTSDLTTADYQQLLACDQDAVNQWQAVQHLYSTSWRELVAEYQESGQCQGRVEPWFATVAELIVDPSRDPALIAHLLQLPKYEEIAHGMPVFDIEAIHHAGCSLRQQLALALQDQLLELYHKYASKKFELSAQAMAVRAFRKKLLLLTYFAAPETGIELASAQYHNSDNMTDTMAALTTLAYADCAETNTALDDFYRRYASKPLVVNKWFTLQATSERPDTIATVEGLLKHESFDLTNPNNVYALVLSFAKSNLWHFHAASGAGYELVTEQICKLNELNPQVAARVISAFFSWRKFDQSRAEKMQQSLLRIKDLPGLSADVYELAEKALA